MRIQFKEHGSWFCGPVKSSELPMYLKYSRSWLDTRQSMEHLSGLSLNLGSEVHWSVSDLFATLGWKFHEKWNSFRISKRSESFPWETYSFLFPVGLGILWLESLLWHFSTSDPHRNMKMLRQTQTMGKKGRGKHSSLLSWTSVTQICWNIPWNMLWGLELITLKCYQSGN